MFFWILLFFGVAFGALWLASGTEAGSQSDDHFSLIYLTLFGFGMVLAGIIRLLVSSGGAALRVLMTGVAVIALIMTISSYREELTDLYARLTTDPMPSVALTHAGGEATLRRAWDGHYRADARINGVEMRLLVDTGASMVLIPYESVAELGVDPNSLSFSVPVTTANGRSSVAPIRLESIRVGEIEVRNVTAAVAQPGRLKMGLLGMSFLDELNQTVFEGDRLILRQDPINGGFEDRRFRKVPGTRNGMFTPDELRDQPKSPI